MLRQAAFFRVNCFAGGQLRAAPPPRLNTPMLRYTQTKQRYKSSRRSTSLLINMKKRRIMGRDCSTAVLFFTCISCTIFRRKRQHKKMNEESSRNLSLNAKSELRCRPNFAIIVCYYFIYACYIIANIQTRRAVVAALTLLISLTIFRK